MSKVDPSSNNPRTRYAPLLDQSGPDTKALTTTEKKPAREINQETLNRLSIPVGVQPEEQDPLKKDYNKLVQKNPYIDSVQRTLGKVSGGTGTAWQAVKEIFGSLGGMTKLGLKRSTSNPLATTIIAGGGSAIAGLLSFRSLINAFKSLSDPKAHSWVISGLQAIIQGGVAIGLGAPFFGQGDKSPFVKRVDGEDVVELKAILGGVGASVLLSAFDALSKDRLPVVSKIPVLKGLAGGIAKDLKDGIDTVTQGEGITPAGQGVGGGGINPALLGQ